MIEFVPMTKELLKNNLDFIMQEVRDFEFIDWSERNYLRDLPDKWKLSIAALSDGVMGGFSINSDKEGIFYIHFFYIFDKYRSSGMGKKLIGSCEKLASNNGMREIQLRCHKDNIRALNFYFQNGFQIKKVDARMQAQYILEKVIPLASFLRGVPSGKGRTKGS
jgi:ribosomal protein S18 acetylase RimI-like enzyme